MYEDMDFTMSKLTLLYILISKLIDASSQKVLCWQKLKKNGEKIVKEDEYILSQYDDVITCCNNGGIATTDYKFPWDKQKFIKRGANPPTKLCKEVVKCKGMDTCACKRDCGSKAVKKVCGTNEKTYKNICELHIAKCKIKQDLKVSYEGECKKYCKDVKCSTGKSCIYDQNGISYCIQRKCANYKKCKAEGEQKKICGMDNTTYQSLCHLRRAECKSFQVIPVRYYDACEEGKLCKDINCNKGEACVVEANGEPRCIKCCKKSQRPVNLKLCGSNGKEYDTWCDLRSDACKTGKMITIDFNEKACKPKKKTK